MRLDRVAECKEGQQHLGCRAPGFPGVGMLLPIMLSEGYHEGLIQLHDVSRILSWQNARLFPQKGAIRIGSDADFAAVDLDTDRVVTPRLHTVGCRLGTSLTAGR